MTGLEPANGGTTNHGLNHLATPAYVELLYYIFIFNPNTCENYLIELKI